MMLKVVVVVAVEGNEDAEELEKGTMGAVGCCDEMGEGKRVEGGGGRDAAKNGRMPRERG